MPSAAPLTVRTAASFSLLAACLTLAGCGNRGELYLPADAAPEPEELAAGRTEGTPPQAPLPDAEAEHRAVTPSDTVNAVTQPMSTDGGVAESGGPGNDGVEGDGGEGDGKRKDEDERAGEGARGVPGTADGAGR